MNQPTPDSKALVLTRAEALALLDICVLAPHEDDAAREQICYKVSALCRAFLRADSNSRSRSFSMRARDCGRKVLHFCSRTISLKQLSRPTMLIAALCLLDLVSTVWLLETQGAAEANPVMQPFLAHSTGAFILAKLTLSVLPLILLEWARRRNPNFVRSACNIAAAAYLVCYVVGVARANAVPEVRELPRDPHVRIHEYRPRSQASAEQFLHPRSVKSENCTPIPAQCL